MNIVAILCVYNEEVYLGRCLEHLFSQGIQAYVIDNESCDRSPDIAKSYLGKGVVGVETFKRRGVYEWEKLLLRKEAVAAELGADWYIHHDTDEIRYAPSRFETLAAGIQAVDRDGYNAVNFDEFVFVPTGMEESYENDRFVEDMQYYYFFQSGPLRRVNAWKNFGQKIDLHSLGGHRVLFDGIRIFPEHFALCHYIVLSYEHAIRKYCRRTYSREEVEKRGWHGARSALRPRDISFPCRSRLHRKAAGAEWDKSSPYTRHIFFKNRRSRWMGWFAEVMKYRFRNWGMSDVKHSRLVASDGTRESSDDA